MTETITVPEGLVLVNLASGTHAQITPLGRALDALASLSTLGAGALEALGDALLLDRMASGEGLLLTYVGAGHSITIARAQGTAEQSKPATAVISTMAATLLHQMVSVLPSTKTVLLKGAAGSFRVAAADN
ncbi:hypothetical protein [Streptomyces sp. NPDC093589]|uniref:hypothetical protein n=1 Tax=Streptomyces sp. NPDC093589 TaxID=3366043 RepID=UPI00382FC2D7